MGVFLPRTPAGQPLGCLPHASGGVSFNSGAASPGYWSSPRQWGCFQWYPTPSSPSAVFPTPVGVFLPESPPDEEELGLPHASGGVSTRKSPLRHIALSSPRQWGCFLKISWRRTGWRVFPTPVGVFLVGTSGLLDIVCLPHASGGVSNRPRPRPETDESSPRQWGCFLDSHAIHLRGNVFPTPVGVFPWGFFALSFSMCLPHASGGVSLCNTLERIERESSPRQWGCFSKKEGRSDRDRVFPTPVGVFLLRCCISR